MTQLMTQTNPDDSAFEPLLAGTLNERFFSAVHKAPVLYYDVVRTGMASPKADYVVMPTPYEIVLLHSGNVTDKLLSQMLALQSEAVTVQKPDATNNVDFKTENDIIGHFIKGGLGFGIFTPDGALIGQNLVYIDMNSATIGWLIVGNEWRGNQLSEGLIDLSSMLAECAGLDSVNANVRMSNQKGFDKFSVAGFAPTSEGVNAKDGSKNYVMAKTFA